MKQTCLYCGAQLPQEAHFCLSCFHVLSSVNGSVSVLDLKKHPLKRSKNRRERAVSLTFSAVLAFGMLFSVCTDWVGRKKLPVLPATNESITESTTTYSADDAASSGDAILAKTEEENTTSTLQALPSLTNLPGGIAGIFPNASKPPAQPSDAIDPTRPQVEPEKPTPPTDPETPEPPTPEPPPKPPTPPAIEYANFEHRNGVIIKYKGNSRVVTIPAVIDGKPITRIQQNAFNGQKNIEEIFFETNYAQPYLWVDPSCIHNLPNLKAIHFPDTDLGIHGNFAKSCPKLDNLTLSSGRYEGQYQVVNGGLYYYTSRDWVLRYYCPGYKATDLKIPPWAIGLENVCNIEENPYLRRIHFDKHSTAFLGGAKMPKQLEAIHVESGNFCGYSKDGVLYEYNYTGMGYDMYTCYYPPGKKDKIFKMDEKAKFDLAWQSNRYITDIYLPNSSVFTNPGFGSNNFGPLTVHIASDHPQRKTLEEDFYGKIIYT